MKTKVSPSIVGAFVIGAMVLAVGALFSFGGVNFFSKPQRFVVFFDESVHGLDQGSQVKLRGVRVGRVIDLNIRYDAQRNRSVIAVICEFSKNVLSDERGEPINVSDRAELQAMIDRGLRARLEVQALATGMLFVGLNFMDPKENPPTPGVSDPRYLVVPFVSSAIVEFQASITEILSNLKKIDFAGISKGLTALLTDIPKRLDAVDLKGMTEQWKKTGAQFEQTGARFESFANGPELKRMFDNLNGAVADLRATIAKLDAQIEPSSQDLAATLAEARKTVQAFSETATAARVFIQSNAGVGDELAGTLEHLNEAADAVKRLADFLERNPNALITGRKRPQ
jgi:paraquat-inducible protein B